MRIVQQRGENDCAHAALATVCGHSYDFVAGQFPRNHPLTDAQALGYLEAHGFRCEIRDGYARPWAPRHLVALRETVGERKGYGHYAVCLRDGQILDPASSSGHSAAGYPLSWDDFASFISPRVEFVIGIWPP